MSEGSSVTSAELVISDDYEDVILPEHVMKQIKEIEQFVESSLFVSLVSLHCFCLLLMSCLLAFLFVCWWAVSFLSVRFSLVRVLR